MSDSQSSCPVGVRLLPAYLAGKLTGTPTEEEFKEHVRACEECKALITDRRKAMQVLLASAETALTQGQSPSPTPSNLSHTSSLLGLKSVPWKLLTGVTASAIFLIALTYIWGPQWSVFGQKMEEKPTQAPSTPTSPATQENPTLQDNSLKTEETTARSAARLSKGEKTTSEPTGSPPSEKPSREKAPSPAKPGGNQPASRSPSVSKVRRQPVQVPSGHSLSTQKGAPKALPSSPKPQAQVEVTDETGKRIGETIIPNQKESK
jgi:hypothetical protein